MTVRHGKDDGSLPNIFCDDEELERVRNGGRGAFAVEFVAIEGCVLLNIARNSGKDVFQLTLPLNPYKMIPLLEQARREASKAMYQSSFDQKNYDLQGSR